MMENGCRCTDMANFMGDSFLVLVLVWSSSSFGNPFSFWMTPGSGFLSPIVFAKIWTL
jgi:hypothetical protein